MLSTVIKTAPQSRTVGELFTDEQKQLELGHESFEASPNKNRPICWSSTRSPRDLSDRQFEILDHLSKGYPAKEIALRLGLSVSTVSIHRQTIYRKLRVNSLAEALHVSVELGLLLKRAHG